MAQIFFQTHGCRLNQIESEGAAKFFLDAGFSVAMENVSHANENEVLLAIVNTCAVTTKAEQKARRSIRLLLEKFPKSLVVITGCYAELEKNLGDFFFEKERVLLLPGKYKSRLSDIAHELKFFLETENEFSNEKFFAVLKKQIFNFPETENKFSENSFKLFTTSFLSHSRAAIKIQDGCNSSCSYCAICLARGKAVSLPFAELKKRVRTLEKNGFSEIVFTAVNLSQYASEHNGELLNFSHALSLLLAETQNVFFRISSMYPEMIDEKFSRVLNHERVRPHFHLSIQSGSNTILRLMNRSYTRARVIEAIKILRRAKPDAFFSCDIIVGFPNESENDFSETLSLCKECDFTFVHAFPFSARKNTKAFSMNGKIPERIAKERVKILHDFSVKQKISYIENFLGKSLRAVAEKKINENEITATTENFIHCKIKLQNEKVKSGDAIFVKLSEVLFDNIANDDEIEACAIISGNV